MFRKARKQRVTLDCAPQNARQRGRFEQLEQRWMLSATNAGGPTVGAFLADSGFVGGGTYSSSTPVAVSGVSGAAPAAVYQTERTGKPNSRDFTFTQSGLVAGESYDIRLHFAEIYHSAAGLRSFDVSINSTQVLNDYDVFVEAGGEDQAVIEEFSATATSGGQVVIEFETEIDNAKVSAIEVIGQMAGGERVLFLRGGDRTGGFLEASNDQQRTEHLADINNFSTSGGNHGWGTLATTLQAAGIVVEQITEGSETSSGSAAGIHVDLETINLAQYDAVVFGSNNAVYDTAAIDAVEGYIRTGGAALFISDANFGGSWADAPNSDQQFLDRFGWTMNQDQGTYSLLRSSGDFDVANHPIFTGVDRFDGEGVSPIVLGTPAAGVTSTLLANAKGQTRENIPPLGGNQQGQSRGVTPSDAALIVADVDQGRIAGHYDRNTFFNQNGAGTNINRFDNSQFAVNLFSWLVGRFEPSADFDSSGAIDGLDFLVWQRGYGTSLGATQAQGDANTDGDVDAQDLQVWQQDFGQSDAAVASLQAARQSAELLALAGWAAEHESSDEASTGETSAAAWEVYFSELGSAFV